MILGFWCSPLHWKCRADVTWGIMASHSLWKDSGHHHGNRSIRSYLIQKGQVKRVKSRQASPHSQAKKIGSDKEVSLLLCAWLLATVCWHLWMEQAAILLESIFKWKFVDKFFVNPPGPQYSLSFHYDPSSCCGRAAGLNFTAESFLNVSQQKKNKTNTSPESTTSITSIAFILCLFALL